MSASSGVPSSGSILSDAGTYKTISAYLGTVFGGIGLAFTYLVVEPVRELANSLGIIIYDFFGDGVAFFLKQIPYQMGNILQSGGQASAEAAGNEGLLGFILAFIIVILGITVYNFARDRIWDGLPFLSWIPFLGDNDEA